MLQNRVVRVVVYSTRLHVLHYLARLSCNSFKYLRNSFVQCYTQELTQAYLHVQYACSVRKYFRTFVLSYFRKYGSTSVLPYTYEGTERISGNKTTKIDTFEGTRTTLYFRTSVIVYRGLKTVFPSFSRGANAWICCLKSQLAAVQSFRSI